MNKVLLGIFIVLMNGSVLAQISSFSCYDYRFTPPSFWPKTQIKFNMKKKTLVIESNSVENNFMNLNQKLKLKKIEIDHIDCDFPNLERGIFWCRFGGYSQLGRPFSDAKLEFFNGDVFLATVGGHLRGVEVLRNSTGLEGEIQKSRGHELFMRIDAKNADFRSDFNLLTIHGNRPICKLEI